MEMKNKGRNFICKELDANFWPIYLYEGGEPYGFCPAKATWEPSISELYSIMALASETGNINLTSGGLFDQSDWWIENISWFLPKYRAAKFAAQVRSVLGDGKAMKAASKLGKQNGNIHR